MKYLTPYNFKVRQCTACGRPTRRGLRYTESTCVDVICAEHGGTFTWPIGAVAFDVKQAALSLFWSFTIKRVSRIIEHERGGDYTS